MYVVQLFDFETLEWVGPVVFRSQSLSEAAKKTVELDGERADAVRTGKESVSRKQHCYRWGGGWTTLKPAPVHEEEWAERGFRIVDPELEFSW